MRIHHTGKPGPYTCTNITTTYVHVGASHWVCSRAKEGTLNSLQFVMNGHVFTMNVLLRGSRK